ncbi:MAG: hypothetical protein O7G83_02460 [Proteobacteria bacterium]|nr:hypothetical protein [Pseudomonadota bacterium]
MDKLTPGHAMAEGPGLGEAFTLAVGPRMADDPNGQVLALRASGIFATIIVDSSLWVG